MATLFWVPSSWALFVSASHRVPLPWVPLTHHCFRSHQTEWPSTAESPTSFHGLTLTQFLCSHSKSTVGCREALAMSIRGVLTQRPTVLWDLHRLPTHLWLAHVAMTQSLSCSVGILRRGQCRSEVVFREHVLLCSFC